jgi:phosphoribosylformylglycinamidine synthase PurS subunit
MFQAVIYVTLKEGVLDPQGVAVKNSLQSLGYKGVEDVRIGKRIDLVVHAEDRLDAEKQVKEMCEKLLSNPVIEQYQFTLEEVDG